MGLIKKILFFIKKPRIILIAGVNRKEVANLINFVLKSRFSTQNQKDLSFPLFFKKTDIFIFNIDLKDNSRIKIYNFLLRNSSLPILAVTRLGDIFEDKIIFPGDSEQSLVVKKIAKNISEPGFFIFNLDDESLRGIKNEIKCSSLSFGFYERADFQAQKLNIGEDFTNFKVKKDNDIVPFWLKGRLGKEEIYVGLCAAAAGFASGMNLVEISQAIRSYKV